MGQKINPVSLRLQYTNRHFDTSWYSGYFYKHLITKDLFLQHYLNNFLKGVKLPAGRYSIQHLQKKTQVYSFLCYPKSTREWRSKLFGLTKKKGFLKKTRYFFKNKTEFKKKWRKNTKLCGFYKTLNQVAIQKIQKKITSFQNFKLWSAVIKTRQKSSFQLFYTDFLSNWTLKSLSPSSKLQKKPTLIKKITQFATRKKLGSLAFRNKKVISNSNLVFNKQFENSNLLFLQNLGVYKTLKSFPQKFEYKNNHKLLKTFSTLGDNRVNSFSAFNSKELSVMKSSNKPLDSQSQNSLESFLSSFYKLELNLFPFKIKNDWQYASYLADELVYFLEKRLPFRRLKKKILKQLEKNQAIRGVRITCSGRVGGKSKKAQRAKTECIRYGQTSLQVFSSKLDFSVKTAFTRFGTVGVKVWICYQ